MEREAELQNRQRQLAEIERQKREELERQERMILEEKLRQQREKVIFY